MGVAINSLPFLTLLEDLVPRSNFKYLHTESNYKIRKRKYVIKVKSLQQIAFVWVLFSARAQLRFLEECKRTPNI